MRQKDAQKAHIHKAHKLLPKEYFKKFGLDPNKYPLVCKEYSLQRSRLAAEKGLGGFKRKVEKAEV
jgi:predicted transcriptional regulator